MQLFDPDLSPAAAEAALLHPQDGGFVTIARKEEGGEKWKERHYHVSAIRNVAEAMRGKSDIYMSQSTFASSRRSTANTKSMRAVYVDLDTYNVDLPQDPQFLAQKIIDRARELKIPNPSYIASSGRGMYAKWVFDQAICASRMKHWQGLQQRLMNAYRPLGADPKVIDAARVMRLQESINSKSGTAVHLIEQGGLISFTDMVRDTADLPIIRRTRDGQIKEVAAGEVRRRGVKLSLEEQLSDEALTDLASIDLYSKKREPAMLQSMTVQSLAWNRFLDLRDLVYARGGIRRGSRDITLFWMATFLAQSGVIVPANFWTEVRALLAGFPTGRDFNPLEDGSMETLIKKINAQSKGEKVIVDGIAYDPIYTPRNDTLLNILSVTPEEERSLRTIISAEEKKRRVDLKCPGRAERRAERQDLREMATSLREQGVSLTEISRQLGRDRSTIVRWLQPRKDAGTLYIETRGRRTKAEKLLNTQPNEHIWYKLTGRGPVRVGGVGYTPTIKEEPRQAAAATARRTHTRSQKPHLLPTARRWNLSEIGDWLKLKRQARAASELARKRWIEPAQLEQREAEAQATFDALLARLRERASGGKQISLSQDACLSSSPITGPPQLDSI